MLVTRIIFEKNFSLLYTAFFDLEQKSATYCSAVAKQMSDHSNLDAFVLNCLSSITRKDWVQKLAAIVFFRTRVLMYKGYHAQQFTRLENESKPEKYKARRAFVRKLPKTFRA